MKFQGWLVALAVVSTAALAQEGDVAPAVAATAVAAGVADSTKDFGYTMGFSMGSRMAAELGAFDTEMYIEGFRDSQAGKASRLSDEQMNAAITAFQQKRMEEMAAARAKLGEKNSADGEAFLKKNGKRKGVKTLKSGLQYEVISKGAGAPPQPTDLVTANYRGTLIDGTEFDASQDGPVSFPLDRVIRGWQEGVALMNKGAKYRFYVPSALAYGERGAGEAIGPNQTLVFEVELVDFGPAPQEVPTGE